MYCKYRLRLPLNKIKENLKQQYDFSITEGGIQKILHNLQNRFNKQYQEIIKEIRKSKVKHVDETSWRIQGQDSWCWLFSNKSSVLYTIEETRGKGVPETILTKTPNGVLVRDDYVVYKNLDMEQQSCWVHLLRVSRETKSNEAQLLYYELKTMFQELQTIIEQPFNQEQRDKQFLCYEQKINKIINTNYKELDTKKVQTRIKNQNTNLITALKHQNVDLTNNLAEQQIRPIVITRKISGGSQSIQGAKTHAVNMSIIQTIALQKKPILKELRKMLSGRVHRFVGEG